MNKSYVYIMTNPGRTTLYVGVTTDLMDRILKHKTNYYPTAFSTKYNCTLLVYFSEFANIKNAIMEEKRIKAGNRKTKLP